jgi:glutamine amidotransferase-like uncharacterized protein
MKSLIALFVFAVTTLLTFGITSPEASAAPMREGLILVYSGPGAGSAFAAAEIPARMGFRTQYVTPEEITPKLLSSAMAWVQPGGNAITAAKAIGPKGLSLIREFVRQGGGYVGFCAGAFLADTTVDDDGKVAGLGIIPVESYDYPLESPTGHALMTWVNWGGRRRHLLFDGGASFRVTPKSTDVTVIATYENDGAPATIKNQFGRGQVVVTGAHPEASYSWKSKDGLIDQDGPDYDLAIEMFDLALEKNELITDHQ